MPNEQDCCSRRPFIINIAIATTTTIIVLFLEGPVKIVQLF